MTQKFDFANGKEKLRIKEKTNRRQKVEDKKVGQSDSEKNERKTTEITNNESNKKKREAGKERK